MAQVWYVSYGSNMASLGPGRYETLLVVGRYDDRPPLTLTSPHGVDDVPHTLPSAAYLSMVADGLRESRGWDEDGIASYLSSITGVRQPL